MTADPLPAEVRKYLEARACQTTASAIRGGCCDARDILAKYPEPKPPFEFYDFDGALIAGFLSVFVRCGDEVWRADDHICNRRFTDLDVRDRGRLVARNGEPYTGPQPS